MSSIATPAVSPALGSSPSVARPRVENRAILRVSVVAAVWGALLSWFLLVLASEAATEASHTAFWLLRITAVYMGALACWVIYNRVLLFVRGPSKLGAGERRTFDADYFGRPVHVAASSDLTHQHLVLAYEEGRKVYRAPVPGEAGAPAPAVAKDVRTPAAAVGAAPSASVSWQEAWSEAHAGDL